MKNFKLVKTTAALALGASVVTAAVVPGATAASAASKYKVSNGKLVNAKTGKVVKGYVVFKSKLYYNGKVKKGYKTVGSGKTIKLYYNGSLKKGYKTARDNKLLFYNGSLKKGYKTAGNGERLYKDGHLDKGYEVYGDVENNPSLYYNGYLKSGYKTANNATLLFYNGKLKEGYKTAKEGTVLYKEGRLNKGLVEVENKLYNDAALAEGVVTYKDEENLYAKGVVVPTTVASASAANESTITLSGAALGKVKADDVTVAGSKVKSITPAADWKSATVVIDGNLIPNRDTKVSVKVGSETKDFTVNYKFGPQAVAVKAQTFDDDTAGQKLSILIDGREVSVDYLKTAGYDVKFTAYNAKTGATTSDLFGTPTSTDGKLQTNLVKGDYLVSVVVSQGSTILSSEKSVVTVTNLDNAATTNLDTVFTLDANKDGDVTDAVDFDLASGTLVHGETAKLTSFKIGNGVAASYAPITGVSVKSSDNSVVSVSGQTIKAEGLGTATLTLTYGNVTKTVTITVKGEQRYAAAVKAVDSTKLIINNANSALKVTLLDQYGDAYTDQTANKVTVSYPTSVTGLTGAASIVSANKYGQISTSFPNLSVAGESGTIVYKNAAGTVIGAVTVTTTAIDNKEKIKLVNTADDSVLNTSDVDDKSLDYILKYYTSENVFNGNVTATDLNNYTIKYNSDLVTLSINGNDKTATNGSYTLNSSDFGSDTYLTFTGKAAGTTTVSIYNSKNELVATDSITVNHGVPIVTGANWKTVGTVNSKGSLSYKDVLDYTEASGTGKLNIVKGLQLSSTAVNSIRVKADGTLFLDENDNGSFDAGEAVLGTISAAASSDSNAALASAVTAGNAVAGISVPTGAKGTVTFTITNPKGNVVATKAVSVDVKEATAGEVAEAQATVAADAFKTTHAAVLNKTVNTVVPNDETSVDSALSAYGSLTAEAKAKLTSQKTLLDSLKAKITDTKDAADVSTAKGKVPTTYTVNNPSAKQASATEIKTAVTTAIDDTTVSVKVDYDTENNKYVITLTKGKTSDTVDVASTAVTAS